VPPDLVRLSNGDLYRGTIIEKVTGDHVTLMLPSGESRRFKMDDVAYAGAADRDQPTPPAQEPASAAPAAGKVEDSNDAAIRFLSEQAEVRLLLRYGSSTGYATGARGTVGITAANYKEICTAPCKARLPVGAQRLALALGREGPVELDNSITIKDRMTLRGHFKSNAGERSGGLAVMLIGGLAGSIVLAFGVAHTGNSCDSFGNCSPALQPNGTLILGGSVVMLAGLIAGIAMLAQKDEVSIDTGAKASPRPPGSAPGDTDDE
jgi:hypothetical protein